MRRIVHVRTGEQGAGAEIDEWIRHQSAGAETCDDAIDACIRIARSRDLPPALVWVGADWLSPQERDLLCYIELGWPGSPTVLYGQPPPGWSPHPGVLHVRGRAELRELLERDLDALLAHIRPFGPAPGGWATVQAAAQPDPEPANQNPPRQAGGSGPVPGAPGSDSPSLGATGSDSPVLGAPGSDSPSLGATGSDGRTPRAKRGVVARCLAHRVLTARCLAHRVLIRPNPSRQARGHGPVLGAAGSVTGFEEQSRLGRECPSVDPVKPVTAEGVFWLGVGIARIGSELGKAQPAPAQVGDLPAERVPDVRLSEPELSRGEKPEAAGGRSALWQRAVLTPAEVEALLGDSAA